LINGKPARVGNTPVVAEGAERPAVAIESKEGSISIAVDTRRACNEERHDTRAAGLHDARHSVVFDEHGFRI